VQAHAEIYRRMARRGWPSLGSSGTAPIVKQLHFGLQRNPYCDSSPAFYSVGTSSWPPNAKTMIPTYQW